MSTADDDGIEDRIIRARFAGIDPRLLARIREITVTELDKLPTDPKVLADDLQTVAALALNAYENVDMLIQLVQQIANSGSIKVDAPKRPDRGRF